MASYSEVGLEKSERLLKKDFLLVGVNEALAGKGKIFFLYSQFDYLRLIEVCMNLIKFLMCWHGLFLNTNK